MSTNITECTKERTMSANITECLSLTVRHPERSEAIDFLSPQRQRPSAVEGPRRFDSEMTATDFFLFMHSRSRRLSITTPSGMPTSAFRPCRSFDSGSLLRRAVTASQRNNCRAQHLAFAQDDGALVFSLISKLYLGTHLSAQFHCPTVARHTRVAVTATN